MWSSGCNSGLRVQYVVTELLLGPYNNSTVSAGYGWPCDQTHTVGPPQFVSYRIPPSLVLNVSLILFSSNSVLLITASGVRVYFRDPVAFPFCRSGICRVLRVFVLVRSPSLFPCYPMRDYCHWVCLKAFPALPDCTNCNQLPRLEIFCQHLSLLSKLFSFFFIFWDWGLLTSKQALILYESKNNQPLISFQPTHPSFCESGWASLTSAVLIGRLQGAEH